MTADVIDELDREWCDLIATRGFIAELGVFIRRHGTLAALRDSPQPPRFGAAEADGVLHALLADCADGSYPAGRTVLQCMVPAMRSIVRRSRRHYPDLGDLQAETAAAMWGAIVGYDLGRTTRVAMRLQGATLTAVVGDHAPHARGRRVSRSGAVMELPASDTVLERMVGHEAGDGATGAAGGQSVLGATGEVLGLLAWGVRSGIIGADDAALLARVHAPDPDRPEYAHLGGERGAYLARIAHDLQITPEALRQRTSRAIRRLARAVHAGRDGY